MKTPLILLTLLAAAIAGNAQVATESSKAAAAPFGASIDLDMDDSQGIRSDRGGTYQNGKAGVHSVINLEKGNYWLSFKENIRTFSVDLSKPVDSTKDPRPGPYTCDHSKKSAISVIDILSIPVGTTAYRRMTIRTYSYMLDRVYHDEQLYWGTDANPSPAVKVTRTSETTWTVETDWKKGASSSWVASHGNKAPFTNDIVAYYDVPFRFYLTRR